MLRSRDSRPRINIRYRPRRRHEPTPRGLALENSASGCPIAFRNKMHILENGGTIEQAKAAMAQAAAGKFEPFTCPTPGCDGNGHIDGTFSTHRTVASCPTAQGPGGQAPSSKKPRYGDTDVLGGLGPATAKSFNDLATGYGNPSGKSGLMPGPGPVLVSPPAPLSQPPTSGPPHGLSAGPPPIGASGLLGRGHPGAHGGNGSVDSNSAHSGNALGSSVGSLIGGIGDHLIAADRAVGAGTNTVAANNSSGRHAGHMHPGLIPVPAVAISHATDDMLALDEEITELKRENARVELQMLRLKSNINAMESQLNNNNHEPKLLEIGTRGIT